MPGFITHQYIVCKSLKTFKKEEKGLIKPLKDSLDKALGYAHTNGGHTKYSEDSGCVAAGFAHIGATGPDLFYLGAGNTNTDFMADLMHYNKTGPYVIYGIGKLKEIFKKNKKLEDPDLNMLAYYMGHSSHVAADVVVHPLVNNLSGAYPDLGKDFCNSRGKNPVALWKAHNIVEHYQDAYSLYHKYPEDPDLKVNVSNWKNIHIGVAAANDYQSDEMKPNYFMIKNGQDYYKHKTKIGDTDSLELQKFNFFLDKNAIMNSSTYFDVTIPDKAMLDRWEFLLVQKEHFNKYVNKAIALTHAFWNEIISYITDPKAVPLYAQGSFEYHQKFFNLLRKHWNLDTGFGPYIGKKDLISFNPINANGPDQNARINLVDLVYENYNKESMTESVIDWGRVKRESDEKAKPKESEKKPDAKESKKEKVKAKKDEIMSKFGHKS